MATHLDLAQNAQRKTGCRKPCYLGPTNQIVVLPWQQSPWVHNCHLCCLGDQRQSLHQLGIGLWNTGSHSDGSEGRNISGLQRIRNTLNLYCLINFNKNSLPANFFFLFLKRGKLYFQDWTDSFLVINQYTCIWKRRI